MNHSIAVSRKDVDAESPKKHVKTGIMQLEVVLNTSIHGQASYHISFHAPGTKVDISRTRQYSKFNGVE